MEEAWEALKGFAEDMLMHSGACSNSRSGARRSQPHEPCRRLERSTHAPTFSKFQERRLRRFARRVQELLRIRSGRAAPNSSEGLALERRLSRDA